MKAREPKCIFLEISSTSPMFGVKQLDPVLSILPLTKKSKVIGLQLRLNRLKLNFEDQNELLKNT